MPAVTQFGGHKMDARSSKAKLAAAIMGTSLCEVCNECGESVEICELHVKTITAKVAVTGRSLGSLISRECDRQ